jgi:hypothetical protein
VDYYPLLHTCTEPCKCPVIPSAHMSPCECFNHPICTFVVLLPRHSHLQSLLSILISPCKVGEFLFCFDNLYLHVFHSSSSAKSAYCDTHRYVLISSSFSVFILILRRKLTTEDILWLHEQQIEEFSDLCGEIPLRLPLLRLVNYEIHIIDPDKQYHYCLPKCTDHYKEQLLQKIKQYTIYC